VKRWRSWSAEAAAAEQDREELAETERYLSELLKSLDAVQIEAGNRPGPEAGSKVNSRKEETLQRNADRKCAGPFEGHRCSNFARR
jgi:hypothetical protein